MKLLCLPYAGGSAQTLKNKLGQYLDSTIEVVLIELPGRGKCFGEKLISDFRELISYLMPRVLAEIDDETEYSLLGYSMGSRIIYALYYEIVNRKLQKPSSLFFCSAVPPNIPYDRKSLDRESIILELKRLGGTDREVLDNSQLMDIFIPIMRADMCVLYSYVYKEVEDKIKVPVIVQYGTHDNDVINYITDWADYVEGPCEFYGYEDGHFFINKFYREIAAVINSKIGKE